MNKAQHTTRYIKHLAESANFKGSTFNKHRNGLIGNRFEMPNVSYTHPLYRNYSGRWWRIFRKTAIMMSKKVFRQTAVRRNLYKLNV